MRKENLREPCEESTKAIRIVGRIQNVRRLAVGGPEEYTCRDWGRSAWASTRRAKPAPEKCNAELGKDHSRGYRHRIT